MALITDPFMKVKNTENVFAVGDCCTIQNEKLVDFLNNVLGEMGVDSNSGSMNREQFTGFILTIAPKRINKQFSPLSQCQRL